MKKVLKTLALMGINVVLAVSSLTPCAMTAVASDYSIEISEEVIISEEDEESFDQEDITIEELPSEDTEEEIVFEGEEETMHLIMIS